jgi:hypothetical protein
MIILHEGLAETIDAAQWCPQVVRDRIAEGFELMVRGFELRRTLDDASLQAFVQMANLGFDPQPRRHIIG